MIATPGNPYLMEKRPGLTLGVGGAEYSGRHPSPKLYEADNEVCRIGGASLSLHQEFYRETLDYASLGAPLKVGWEGAGLKERCLKAVSVTPQRCKV